MTPQPSAPSPDRAGRNRAEPERRVTVLLAVVLAAAARQPAAAQVAKQPTATQAPRRDPAEPDQPAERDTTVSEVVVTGRRAPQLGAVVGDIKPELQLSPSDIRSYGVSTVTELLSELSPETRSDRGRGGEAPVVLLNGRRISGLNEVRDIPVEAILRVDILPEEVALKYGYSADQRVVNIVLRRRFRAITAELTGGGPTEGGQESGQAEGDLLHIRGDDRLNLDLKYGVSSALTEASRNVTLLGGARTPGAQGAPAVSVVTGPTDVRPYRTLLPRTQSFSANGVLSRALPWGVAATLNATLGATASDAEEGLPGVILTVPVADPFAPAGAAVAAQRDVGAFGPLRQSTNGWTAHLGTTLNKDRGDWRLSLTGAYDYGFSQTGSDVGVDGSRLQGLLNAASPTLNPFDPLPASLLTTLPRDTAVSNTHSGNVQFLANGPLLNVPAGQLYASFKVGDAESLLDSSSFREGRTQDVSLSRNDLNTQVNLDLPIAGGRKEVFAPIGDLSLNVNAAVDQLSDFGTLTTYGYGLNWTPRTGVNLIVSHTHDEAAPTESQLGGPVVTTPGVRLFDYATGQTVSVTQIGGGTAGLVADSREVTKIGLTLKPVVGQDLTLSANYIDSRIKNPIQTFPAATSEIEAAFPARFIRDGSGQLTDVDLRPVNFLSEDREELRYGLNYSRPIGAQPSPRVRRPDGEDGDRRRGGGGGYGGGRGGSGGGGGFGGGRGGFGGINGPSPGRLQLAVYHTILFKDRFLVRPGGPVLDLLNGSAAGSGGGQPRHEVEVQAGYTLNGLGARLSADWKNATFVRGAPGSPTGDLNFSDLGTVNLRLFANLGQMRSLVTKHPWLRGSRITLSAINLLDTRQQVRDATGATPLGYQPAYLDPAGRVIRLGVRKLFY